MSKDYTRLVPRIASMIDSVLEYEGRDGLLVQYSTIILRRDYGVSWHGGKPHTLEADELSFAYLDECNHYDDLKESLDLATQIGGSPSGFLLHKAVDIISTQLGFLLKQRANAEDINL